MLYSLRICDLVEILPRRPPAHRRLHLFDGEARLGAEAFGHHLVLALDDARLLLHREFLEFGLQLLDHDALLLQLTLGLLQLLHALLTVAGGADDLGQPVAHGPEVFHLDGDAQYLRGLLGGATGSLGN